MSVRLSDPVTSHHAARVPRTGIAPRVLAAHIRFADRGLTDEELADLFPDLNRGSVVKRRTELTRAGLLRDWGRTRRTRRGCQALVWQPTAEGVQVAHRMELRFDGKRPHESEARYRDRVEWRCHDQSCGRAYATERGLLAHQVAVHGFTTLRRLEGRSSPDGGT